MTPSKRPTPLTDAASFGTDDESLNRLYGIRELPKYVVPVDFARTLERNLAERTEERDKLLEKQSWLIAHPTAIEAAHQVVEWTKCEQERDDAIAKLAAANAAIFEAKFGAFGEHQLGVQLHSKLLEIERLNKDLTAALKERDALKAKLATINHIAMSLFVRTTSSEVTGEMAEIGRLSREDGQ